MLYFFLREIEIVEFGFFAEPFPKPVVSVEIVKFATFLCIHNLQDLFDFYVRLHYVGREEEKGGGWRGGGERREGVGWDGGRGGGGRREGVGWGKT